MIASGLGACRRFFRLKAKKKYVIIGDGAAGITAASYLRQGDPDGIIEIYSDDPNPAYFRAALTNYLIGELRDDQIWAVPPDFYTEFNIQRQLARVLEIDTANARIRLASGAVEPYDQLLIATGSRANTLDIEGIHLPGVMTLRTLQDVRQVLDWASEHALRRAVIVGGGPLAMEWAQGLSERNVQVTMVIRDDHLMRRELDATASDLVEARLRLHGINLLLDEEVVAAVPGKDGYVAAMQLKSGGTLPCDLFGVAIGVRCNSELLKGSPLALAENGAVIVDDRQRTAVDNVYAAGDVAQVNGVTLQLWEPARLQGRTAAANMLGREAATDLSGYYFATRLYDLDFALVSRPAPPAATALIDFPQGTGRMAYRKLQIAEGRLVSALLLGERQEKIRARGRLYQRLIREQIDISSIQDRLLDPDFDLARWLNAQRAGPVEKISGAGDGSIKSSADLRREQPVAGSALAQTQEAEVTTAAGKTLTSVGLNTGQLKIASVYDSETVSAVIEAGDERWPLNMIVTLIGRSPEAAIPLNDPGVSLVHAQITRQGDKYFLRDLGSRNGTWVNDRQVSMPVMLHNGDQIELGRKQLLFKSEDNSSVAAFTPTPDGADIGQAERRLAVLVGRTGVVLGLEFELAESPLTVGRDPGCDVRINDPTVSRWHAWLTEAAGLWYITDTGSANGTLINGEEIKPNERRLLNEGDKIELGNVAVKYKHWLGEG